MTTQVPTGKSLRLAKVDIDLSWKAVEARALAEAEKEVKNCEMPSSDSSDDYKVAAKKKKTQKSKDMYLRQSSDEWEMPSSDSSDDDEEEEEDDDEDDDDEEDDDEEDDDDDDEEYDDDEEEYDDDENDNEYDDDDENNVHQKQSAVKCKKRTPKKNKSSSHSSDDHKVKKLSEYEKMIQKNRDEKLAFLQSLKMDEIKEDLKESIKKLKPKRHHNERTKSVSIRKSLRLADVHINFSEKALESRAINYAERIRKGQVQSVRLKNLQKKKTETFPRSYNNMCLRPSAVKYKKYTDIKNESSDKCEMLSSDSSDDDKVKKLSEYEKMIQKNRDEKLAFLQSLKMDEIKEGLKEGIKKLKPERHLIERPKGVSVRKSLRLADVDINFSEEALESRAVYYGNERTKNGKEIKKELTFEEAIVEDCVYADFIHDFDDLDFKTPEPFTGYVSCFENMKINKSKIAEVVSPCLTAMALHPMKDKIIVSAGNSHGTIGFWHVNSDCFTYEFKPHLSRVSCLKFNSGSLNQIISCSHDGTMRCGDMEKRVFNEVFNISEETSCSYFDFISPTTTIVCQGNGNVSVVDIRSSSKFAGKSYKCHESLIRTIDVHPVNKCYFVSADIKGFLSLWDLRNIQKYKPVLDVHYHEKCITSAFFSPVTGNSVLTASTEDSLCLLDCSKLGTTLSLSKRMWYNMKGSPKASWLPNTDDAFVIRNMWNPKRIDVYNNLLNNIYSFQHVYLTSGLNNNAFHPSLPVLAVGNDMGKMFVFS